jgi:hypothetical protein
MRVLVGLLLVIAAAGCKSRPWGPYISPQVTGQVLASDTGKPLAGVRVTRGSGDNGRSLVEPPKGGELLMLKPPVITREDGRFDLECQRVLSIWRGSSWNVVPLTFACPGYLVLHTNCQSTGAIKEGKGGLVLDIGSVFLESIPR